MKPFIVSFCLAFAFIVPAARADIIAGPIANPGNGQDYYLLAPDTWTASEAEAEKLGGTLAIIRNAAEQEWVSSTFSGYGGTDRNLWIGLRRSHPGEPLAWVSDTPVTYSNWDRGQPDNAGGKECYVHMLSRTANRKSGTWNDVADGISVDGAPVCGVVEVPREKSLTAKEKSLIGTWYASGDRGHPCWITATKNMLFQIFDQRAFRLVSTPQGSLLVLTPQHEISGQVIQDKILWSNGTWWSRNPDESDDPQMEGLDRAAGPKVDVPVY